MLWFRSKSEIRYEAKFDDLFRLKSIKCFQSENIKKIQGSQQVAFAASNFIKLQNIEKNILKSLANWAQ